MTASTPPRTALPDRLLLQLLDDDVPFGDLTTESLQLSAEPARISFAARRAMCLAAAEEAARLFELAGGQHPWVLPSGTRLAAGQVFLRLEGPAGVLLTAWKLAQTLVEYAAGIATGTAAMIDTLREAGFDTAVACTRKNFPGTKAIAVRAVRAGGGTLHRLGLSDTLLVFPEHLALIAPAERAAALAGLRRRCPERMLVAEAGSPEAAFELARLGVDVLQLEKFTPAQLADCRAALLPLGRMPLLAAAGGVNRDNALDYARAGADLLVTSAPYFSPPADVQVLVERAT